LSDNLESIFNLDNHCYFSEKVWKSSQLFIHEFTWKLKSTFNYSLYNKKPFGYGQIKIKKRLKKLFVKGQRKDTNFLFREITTFFQYFYQQKRILRFQMTTAPASDLLWGRSSDKVHLLVKGSNISAAAMVILAL